MPGFQAKQPVINSEAQLQSTGPQTPPKVPLKAVPEVRRPAMVKRTIITEEAPSTTGDITDLKTTGRKILRETSYDFENGEYKPTGEETVYDIDSQTQKPTIALKAEKRPMKAYGDQLVQPAPILSVEQPTVESKTVETNENVIKIKRVTPQGLVTEKIYAGKSPLLEIPKARNYDELIDAFAKFDEIADDDGSIYTSEYLKDIAEFLQTATPEQYPKPDSPLLMSLPEKYGIRKTFQRLVETTKPESPRPIEKPVKESKTNPALKEIEKAMTYGQLIDTLRKIDIIADDDGSIYSASDLIQIAQYLQTATEEQGITKQSPLISSLPAKYGIRETFQRLIENLPPVSNLEITPEAEQPVAQPELMEKEIELDFTDLIPESEVIIENSYQNSAQYKDVSDQMHKKAQELLSKYESWGVKTTDPNFEQNPYYKEFNFTRRLAHVSAILSDRYARYAMIDQEIQEISEAAKDNPENEAPNKTLERMARTSEVTAERAVLADEIRRLDSEFLALDSNIEIQRYQQETAYTREEEKALQELAVVYSKLNQAERDLEKEKSGFLNKLSSLFKSDKKKKIEAAEDIVRAYRNRFTTAQTNADAARASYSARMAKKYE